jgi:transcriptional regulator with PAS, ATPase and Fis domain
MLVLAADAPELTASMVSSRVAGAVVSSPRPLRDVIDVAEADAIVAALGRHTGDRDAAAADLGVSRGYLDARSRALGLDHGGA